MSGIHKAGIQMSVLDQSGRTGMQGVTVTVPATTANLGPGFDCIGAALGLYNQFHFAPLPPSQADQTLEIVVTGQGADRVTLDASNMAYRAVVRLYEQLGKTPPPMRIAIDMGIPLARGLGSSATAIVGGLVGANYLAGSPLGQREVMQLAIAMEGHPDNVVPALIGGCQLATAIANSDNTNSDNTNSDTSGLQPTHLICQIPWHADIIPVIAIPQFELSTKAARQVLPPHYDRADAIFNTAHLGLLIRGLDSGKPEWLRVALADRIHQPYRQSLIPGYEAVQSAAIAAGAYGMVISGAGPTLLALTDSAHAPAVAAAMETAWQTAEMTAIAKILSLDHQGTTITPDVG